MTRDHFIYWLYGADGDCLYVGITIQPEARWKAHRRRFGTEVARKRMAGPYTKATARRIERDEQDRLRPKYDGRWGPVREREARRAARRVEEAGWPVYSIAELAPLIGMPEVMLRGFVGPNVKFIKLAPDEEVSA